MAKLIRLRKGHKKRKWFKHPLLDDAKPKTEEELKEIAATCDRDSLVDALRSILRYQVSLYLGSFKSTREYLDDMVSEGFLAIMSASDEILLDFDPECDILKIATNRIRYFIEKMLNTSINLIGPKFTVQRERSAKGKDPTGFQKVLSCVPESEHPSDEDDTYKRDVLEALESIEAKDRIDATILCQEYWDNSSYEIAEVLGVDPSTIRARREELYQEFLKLTR